MTLDTWVLLLDGFRAGRSLSSGKVIDLNVRVLVGNQICEEAVLFPVYKGIALLLCGPSRNCV